MFSWMDGFSGAIRAGKGRFPMKWLDDGGVRKLWNSRRDMTGTAPHGRRECHGMQWKGGAADATVADGSPSGISGNGDGEID